MELQDKQLYLWQLLAIPILLVGVGCAIVISPLVSLFAISALFLIVCIFLKPYAGLHLAIATSPIMVFEIVYDSPTRQISDYYPLSYTIILVTLLAWIPRQVVSLKERDRSYNNKYFLPFLFISYAIISLFWTIDLPHGICLTSRILVGIFFFVLLNEMVRDQLHLEKLVNYLPFIGLALGCLTLLSKFKTVENVQNLAGDFYLQILFWPQSGVRPSGFANSALAANTLVFFIFITIAAYSLATTTLRRAILIVIGLFCLSMMLLISSKAAVGALLIGVFYIIIFHPVFEKKRITSLALVLLTLIGVYTFNAVFMTGGERLTGSSEVASASLSSRLGFWKTGFTYFKSRWIGAGAGGILKVIDPIPNSHSTYFSVLFDYGFAGASIFLLFLINTGFHLKKAIRCCTNINLLWILFSVSGAYVALLIHALVDNFHYDSYFWLVLGLVHTSSTIAQSNFSSVSSS